ncbi:hypothetical protein [Chromobacterium haemolyticum]|uniref:hypothetical protein n=1 Tax=Chromobacterium haemolyticum TaxID=394935 RepID=UPI001131E929|nr:hypothetical protein [Chromobacterium haemolyticum]
MALLQKCIIVIICMFLPWLIFLSVGDKSGLLGSSKPIHYELKTIDKEGHVFTASMTEVFGAYDQNMAMVSLIGELQEDRGDGLVEVFPVRRIAMRQYWKIDTYYFFKTEVSSSLVGDKISDEVAMRYVSPLLEVGYVSHGQFFKVNSESYIFDNISRLPGCFKLTERSPFFL